MRRIRPLALTARARAARGVLAALSLMFPIVFAGADDWPSWRGPSGDGVCHERDVPLRWGEGENVRWRVPLPDRGNSTPAVWGDRVFVTQAIEREHRRTLMCFARADGKLLWQSGVTYAGREPTNGQNPYCAASPATDGTHVVAYFGSAGLSCYDADGRERWHRDVGRVDSWQGSGSSPVIYKDACFLNAGPGTEAALLACRLADGELLWSITPPLTPPKRAGEPPAPRPPEDAPPAPATRPASGAGFDGAMMAADPSGAGGFLGSWSTPVVLRAGSQDQLVVVHASRVTAYSPATGAVIWTCGGLPDQAFASPAIGEGVLVAMGHRPAEGGTRVTAVRLDADGAARGDVTGTYRLWQTDLPKDCVGSGVIAAGHVFFATQFGTAVCLELRSGKKVWEKRLSGHGSAGGSWSSMVLADGKLLVPNHVGEVFVLRAAAQFELIGSNLAREETTCASLALSDGQALLRTYDALWCFGPGGAGVREPPPAGRR